MSSSYQIGNPVGSTPNMVQYISLGTVGLTHVALITR